MLPLRAHAAFRTSNGTGNVADLDGSLERAARMVGRRLMWRVLRHAAPVISVDVAGIRYHVSTKDREIGHKLYVRGEFELDVLQRTNDLLNRSGRYGIRDKVFIDIGANIGSATLLATVKFGAQSGIAFEPEPENFTLLRTNLIANHLEDRVLAVNMALSDESGQGWLELNPANSGNHHLRNAEPSGNRAVKVPTERFDEWVANGEISLNDVGLVWIDVEGAETRVLEGAKRLLHADVPVVMEYWPEALINDRDNLHEILRDSYTRFVDLRDRASRPEPIGRLHDLDRRMGVNRRILTDILLLKD